MHGSSGRVRDTSTLLPLKRAMHHTSWITQYNPASGEMVYSVRMPAVLIKTREQGLSTAATCRTLEAAKCAWASFQNLPCTQWMMPRITAGQHGSTSAFSAYPRSLVLACYVVWLERALMPGCMYTGWQGISRSMIDRLGDLPSYLWASRMPCCGL